MLTNQRILIAINDVPTFEIQFDHENRRITDLVRRHEGACMADEILKPEDCTYDGVEFRFNELTNQYGFKGKFEYKPLHNILWGLHTKTYFPNKTNVYIQNI